MNIPNLITLLRIILVPVVVILLIQGSFLKALDRVRHCRPVRRPRRVSRQGPAPADRPRGLSWIPLPTRRFWRVPL
ncbi:MAG: hypothetical protein MZV70_67505 [Desulfobacterales bacterium]|nr:hypothetical protein [Desulfobacterales bacterium]